MAQAAGVRHEIVPVAGDRDTVQTFLAMVRSLDGQLADSSSLAVYQLCAAVRAKVKVAFSGDGADEFFGGYATYRASRIAAAVQPFVPTMLSELVARAFHRLSATKEKPVSRTERAARFAQGLLAPSGACHAYWRCLMPPPVLSRLCGREMRALDGVHNPFQRYIDAIQDADATDGVLGSCLLADQRYYLPADMLMKVDAMSMAHGLEVRVPFLDRRIMEFAGRLDSRLLTPMWGPDKKLLRQALSRLGAPAGVCKGQKSGFNVPIAKLMRTSLAPLCDQLLDDEVDRLEPYLEPAMVRRLWSAHREQRANHGYALWCLLTFAAWKRELRP